MPAPCTTVRYKLLHQTHISHHRCHSRKNRKQSLLALNLRFDLVLAQLPQLHLLLHRRSRNLKRLFHPRITNPAQPRHRPQHLRVDEVPLLINRILPHPELHPFHHRQHTRLLPWRDFTFKLPRRDELRFDAKDTLLDAFRFHKTRVGGREAGDAPLGGTVGEVDGAGVGGLDEVLGNDVDGALGGVEEVSERVFGFVEAAGEPQCEDRGVVVYDLEVAEGGEVGGGVVGRGSGDEADGAWDDAGDEELVVGYGGAGGVVGVDADVGRGGGVVGAGAVGPGWVGGFGEVE